MHLSGVEFIYADYRDLKNGLTTDIYFLRTKKILENEGLDNVEVNAEFTPSSFPKGYPWAVLGGLRDVAKLLEGLPVDVDAIPEGTVFFKEDYYGVKEPVINIRGPYASFAIYETPILGFLAYGSGVATKASRIKLLAGDAIVLSFGARRTHPAVSPFNAFYAYIGGCDGVSCVLGAEKFLGIKPTGTMPHSLMIIFKALRGDHTKAWEAFDKHMPPDVPRIILVDTFYDEKTEALMAAEKLGPKIYGIRLDTPSSRRGDLSKIVREIKWELKLRGFDHIKIAVSGGIDEDSIPLLKTAGVDAFGVGSAIANARIIDIAMDITAVKKDGRWIPITKRGKFSGIKTIYRCPSCFIDIVASTDKEAPACPKCGSKMQNLMKPVIRNGKIVMDFQTPEKEREYVLQQVRRLKLDKKPWE
ncbi:MAG: nicotinate phosphoribosyltransferase [Thermoproteales archaeon]|nr:nicotinate phosphoribosyltransferase [Thermoproteales archaeon]